MKSRAKRRPKAILIAGPTASGKSALALRLAKELDGCVVNADSMQVYADLALLTARPTASETGGVPHLLYGTVDGARTYSVSAWLADVREALSRAAADGILPIVVGGTGLYFKALTQGLSDIPSVPSAVRQDIRSWAAGKPPEALHGELARRDPATAAGLRPTDPQRVLRALEVHAATGESLSAFQGRREPAVLPSGDVVAVGLHVDRGVLRERIDRRFDRMIAEGALEEVRALASRRLDPAVPVMRAIGVPPLLRHLAGGMTLEEAMAEAKLASRQYIKRQATFLRHQLPEFHPLTPEEAVTALLAAAQSSA